MRIELYPAFEEVFVDQTLKGIFYPLCSIILRNEAETKLHFVSSNGIWTNDSNASENNSGQFITFDIIGGKYAFSGDTNLYSGYKEAKEIFAVIEVDFMENGRKYLDAKLKVKDYLNETKNIIPQIADESFDLDYYLKTFYEFSINKLNSQLNRGFGQFQRIIDGYAKPEKSPIVYEDSKTLNQIEVPTIKNMENFKVIGVTIGSEFFTDGNDVILLYNDIDNKVLCVNSYS